MQLGIHNVVVLNDWQAVNDAFHKDAFLGRPKVTPFNTNEEEAGIILRHQELFFNDFIIGMIDMNGSPWREHRRLTLQVLRDLGFGKGSMEDRIVDEISHLTRYIDKTDGKPFNIHTVLVPSMSNIICYLIYGHRYEFDDPRRVMNDKILDRISTRFFSTIGMSATAPVWLTKLIVPIKFLQLFSLSELRMLSKLFK